MARFDWIRFDPDGTGGGGTNGVVDEFDGTTLGAAWERDPRRPERGRQRRHAADPGPAGRHLPDPQRRQEPDRPRRADAVPGRRPRSSTSRAPPSTTRPGSWSTATTTTSRSSAASRTRAAGDEKFEFIYENNAVARNEAADSTANIPADFPDDFCVRLTSDGTNVIGHYSTDGTDLDPGRAPGAAPGQRQDRPVRVLQRRRRQPGRGLRLVHADDARWRWRRRHAVRPELRRPVRRRDARQDALERDRPRHARRSTTWPAASSGYTLSQGDIYTGDTNPPPNNFILQDAVARGRGLGDRDQDQRLHARRRLRPGRPDRLRATATTT